MRDYSIACYSGDEILQYIPALAALRIQVFAEYPYLYAGNEAYEARYLENFSKAPFAFVVLAKNQTNQIVGCSTGSSLAGHHQEFSQPLLNAGFDLSSTFYFGESVLDRNWRGLGLGHLFFDKRESFARKAGFSRACFCAIEKDENDPAKPENYFPLNKFWIKRGFEKLDTIKTSFKWPEKQGGEELSHTMAYWIKEF